MCWLLMFYLIPFINKSFDLINNHAWAFLKQIVSQTSNTYRNIGIHSNPTIIQTDYQYNHNATKLAVADSDGYVYIYHRNA